MNEKLDKLNNDFIKSTVKTIKLLRNETTKSFKEIEILLIEKLKIIAETFEIFDEQVFNKMVETTKLILKEMETKEKS